MRSERGQASVEWIGVVLLVALGLAAAARLAPRTGDEAVGHELVGSIACAARGGCEGGAGRRALPTARQPASPRREVGSSAELVTAPPLVPVAPADRAERPRRPRLPRPPRPGPELLDRARRAGGAFWRRAWILCLGYERAREGVLHPRSRFPGHPIPAAEVVRIANDCLSPVDLVRGLEQPRQR